MQDQLLINVETLLSEALRVYQRDLEETSKDQTRRFNLFIILDRARDEEKGHSKFLSEILSPKGSHGLKDKFLNIFLDDLSVFINSKIASNIESEVVIEKFAPFEGWGGRIDIRIETLDTIIVIENKIDALDQYLQLARYQKYTKSNNPKNKNIVLIYLTLDGHAPSSESLGDLPIDSVLNLSYKSFILEFVKKCICESEQYPVVRESLIQYKKLVEELTGEKINMATVMELKQKIDSKDKLKAALLIAKATEELRIDIEKSFWSILVDKLKVNLVNDGVELNYLCSESFNNEKIVKDSPYYGLYVRIMEIEDKFLCFCINKEKGSLYLGLRFFCKTHKLIDHRDCKTLCNQVYDKVKHLYFDPGSSNWFVIWSRPEHGKGLNMRHIYDNEFIELIDPNVREVFVEKISSEITILIKESKAALNK